MDNTEIDIDEVLSDLETRIRNKIPLNQDEIEYIIELSGIN